MRSSRSAALGAVLLLAFGAAPEAASQPANVPEAYKKSFVRFVDSRSITEKALNLIGLSGQDLGRSFALVAGVDSYPNLSGTDKTLNAARVDVESVVAYLREVEFFDEIVVLRNEAVTDEALKYFFQAYFPDRLRSFPKSRFLFAYSGHGIQDGQRGYLLQAKAMSFTDKANSINLEALNTIYRETTEAAYQSLALINACYGGVFAHRPFGDGPNRLLPREPGAHAISAGAANELTWSLPNIAPGSLFFAKVFDGLAGSADSEPRQADGSRGDGVVTANELYSYVAQAVQLATDQKQHPVLGQLSKSGQNGEFFFLNRKRQVAAGTIAEWKLDGKPMGPGPTAPAEAKSDWVRDGLKALALGNFAEAVLKLEQGCTAGDMPACAELGEATRGGVNNLPPNSLGATELFRRACSGGSLRGCTYLGFLYETGRGGIAKDTTQAVNLYRRACEGGDHLGCAYLGGAYEDGIGGLVKDEARASALYQASCEAEELRGCVFLADLLYERAAGNEKNLRLAVSMYQRACEAGDAAGCLRTGDAHKQGTGGLTKSEERAMESFRRACDRGSLIGCTELGLDFAFSKGGLRKDEAKAVSLYRRACDRESARGCILLGEAYFRGQGGLPLSQSRAVELYRQACDGDDAFGCTQLGIAYSKGQGGLSIDDPGATRLFRKACELGDPRGCTFVGVALELGKGGLRSDLAQAASFYKKGCDGNDPQGCNRLGMMYYQGKGGLERDELQALDFWEKACEAGLQAACENRQRFYTDN